MELDRTLSAYDYTLPPERIAQNPVVPRDHARLLVVQNQVNYHHARFYQLPELLKPGDLLVMNDTKVIPARLYGQKTSGLPVEVLLLEPRLQPDEPVTFYAKQWLALVKPGRRLKPGAEILFSAPATNGERAETLLKATIMATDPETSGRIIQFEVPQGGDLEPLLMKLGQVPLPPYITQSEALPDQYQTVYANRDGAVAAPTAGLHFTPELLQKLDQVGISHTFVTLHVGVGTFRPVEADDITAHQMHAEWIDVPASTVDLIRQTKARGGRVIAVGTTVVRSLEGAAESGQLLPMQGKTNLYIYPGYRWKVVDGMITNFHLPRSSLMMLVSALIGRQRLLDLYQIAIDEHYRFYSFGDAMLVLPEAHVTG